MTVKLDLLDRSLRDAGLADTIGWPDISGREYFGRRLFIFASLRLGLNQ